MKGTISEGKVVSLLLPTTFLFGMRSLRAIPRIPKAKKNSKELVILRVSKSTAGFEICVVNGETNDGAQNTIQLCQIKWSPDMGTWDPRTWASMIAMCLLKSEIADGREIYQIGQRTIDQ